MQKASDEEVPRYARPKILAIDIGSKDVNALRNAGFNIASGSFGTPLLGEKSDRYFPVPVNGSLPNASEQELIVADLESSPVSDEFRAGDTPIEEGMWQRMDTGVLDPRPFLMDYGRRKFFERIYRHGGAFVFFTAPRVCPRYEFASARTLGYGSEAHLDNWSVISALAPLGVETDPGTEINPVKGLDPALAGALESATFSCTIDPGDYDENGWVTLATNKYGRTVAGVLLPRKEREGLVFLLPRVLDKGAVLLALFEDMLPHLAPKLFPEDERGAWTAAEVYALPGINDRRRKIDEVEKVAAAEVGRLRKEIEALETERAYLHELLTASGDDLVAAVKRTLESMGFSGVRDVDREEGQVDGRLREDLQIWRDPTPVVLTEVKGIGGMPRDGDVFQVLKNVPARMKQWERFDVRCLAVFNHQRGLPPLEREKNPFQRAQSEHAAHEELGLITTWDLYRLARGYADNGWQPQDVATLLTETSGLIPAIPSHYEKIGKVDNYFERPEVIVIQLDGGVKLKVGERIGFALTTEFYEETVESIQMEGENLEVAPAGATIGVKTRLGKKRAREKPLVHRIAR